MRAQSLIMGFPDMGVVLTENNSTLLEQAWIGLSHKTKEFKYNGTTNLSLYTDMEFSGELFAMETTGHCNWPYHWQTNICTGTCII